MPGLSNLADRIRGVMELLLEETEADALLMVTMTEEEPDMVSVDTALASPTDVVESEGLPFIIARAAEEDIRSYDDHPEDKAVKGTGAFEDDPIMRPDEHLDMPEQVPNLDEREPIPPSAQPNHEPSPGDGVSRFSADVEMWNPGGPAKSSVTMTEHVYGDAEEMVAHLRRIADDIERDVL